MTKEKKVVFGRLGLMRNDSLPKNKKIAKSTEAVLFGESSQLDSLGLVNLIVSTEEKLEEEFGVYVTLADEKAMSQKNSPFRTVTSLAQYISLILEEDEK